MPWILFHCDVERAVFLLTTDFNLVDLLLFLSKYPFLFFFWFQAKAYILTGSECRIKTFCYSFTEIKTWLALCFHLWARNAVQWSHKAGMRKQEKKNEEALIYRGIKLPVEKNIIVLERRNLNICASEGRFRRLSYSLLHFKID